MQRVFGVNPFPLGLITHPGIVEAWRYFFRLKKMQRTENKGRDCTQLLQNCEIYSDMDIYIDITSLLINIINDYSTNVSKALQSIPNFPKMGAILKIRVFFCWFTVTTLSLSLP
jgi:hypothetical protein